MSWSSACSVLVSSSNSCCSCCCCPGRLGTSDSALPLETERPPQCQSACRDRPLHACTGGQGEAPGQGHSPLVPAHQWQHLTLREQPGIGRRELWAVLGTRNKSRPELNPTSREALNSVHAQYPHKRQNTKVTAVLTLLPVFPQGPVGNLGRGDPEEAE